jgi:uncharacterized RDD family membrane protein YckC
MGCTYHPEVESDLERCSRCGEPFCPDCFVVLRDQPFCPACKIEHVRDLRSGLTPGALDLGSVGRRFLGVWLDGFITGIASYAIIIPLVLLSVGVTAGSKPEAEPSSAQLIVSLMMYPVLFGLPLVYEGFMLQRRGQTLGKMALGLKVVTPEGNDIGKGQAWSRAALKVLLGSCVGIDYIPAFFTREKTCFHDMIARTRVVRLRP